MCLLSHFCCNFRFLICHYQADDETIYTAPQGALDIYKGPQACQTASDTLQSATWSFVAVISNNYVFDRHTLDPVYFLVFNWISHSGGAFAWISNPPPCSAWEVLNATDACYNHLDPALHWTTNILPNPLALSYNMNIFADLYRWIGCRLAIPDVFSSL